jgi:hypothetical protein
MKNFFFFFFFFVVFFFKFLTSEALLVCVYVQQHSEGVTPEELTFHRPFILNGTDVC